MSAFTHGRSGSADGRDAVALATRGASLDARGSGARSAGLLAALLAALLLASLFAIATSAQGATVGSRVQLGTFCTETGETGGRCGAARGVAVNRSGVGGVDPGTVYIANFLNRRIEQFSEGEFVRAFGWDVVASGENDVGVGFEICEADSDPVDVCKQGLQVPDPGAISNTEDVVVDPQTGNVLVADNGGAAGKRISVYSATGEFQAAFGIGVQTGAPSLELCTATTGCQAGTASVAAGGLSNLLKAALAVDPVSGNLFVGERGTRRVSEFSFT
ncbi:MAG TPA: hypothetical protein VK889_07640, partial [Solirubrobacterales bacterium]|nr:hypothetical protein [Solirubrobacterales bacterium]